MLRRVNRRLSEIGPLVLLAAAGAIVIVWLVVRGGLGGPSPLAAVPDDSFLVLTLDVRAFAESPLAEALVGNGKDKPGSASRLLGVDTITESCGFNPLTRLRAIAVTVPETGEGGDFGVIASGDISRAELTKCAEAMIARRGGHAQTSAIGSFTVVEDDRAARDPEALPPKVAFRDGGPTIVGRGAWLTRMIDTAEGRVPSVERSAEHASLRSALAARDSAARALVLTAILPKSLRDRLKNEMADEAKDGTGNATMAGVLGVASAGLALHAGAPGADTFVYAELRCESKDACAQVDKLIAKKRFAWSRDFGLRLAGMGPMIDNLETHADPARATALLVSTHAPTDAIATALERALAPRRPRAPSPTSAPLASSPAAPAPSAAPDEVIRLGKDGGAAHAAGSAGDASATRK
jgi:hypothetical protein